LEIGRQEGSKRQAERTFLIERVRKTTTSLKKEKKRSFLSTKGKETYACLNPTLIPRGLDERSVVVGFAESCFYLEKIPKEGRN